MFVKFNKAYIRVRDSGSEVICRVADVHVRRDSIESVEFDEFRFRDDFIDEDHEYVLRHTDLAINWRRINHEKCLPYDMYAMFKVRLSSGETLNALAAYYMCPMDDYQWVGDNEYVRLMVNSITQVCEKTGNSTFRFSDPSLFHRDLDLLTERWISPMDYYYDRRWRPEDYFGLRSNRFNEDLDPYRLAWRLCGEPKTWEEIFSKTSSLVGHLEHLVS